MVKAASEVATDVTLPGEKAENARERFAAFVRALDRASRTVAVHDSDADGVTAAVVWQKAFERLGFSSLHRVVPSRLRDAWSADNKRLIADAAPEALFALDLGSRSEVLVPEVPVCIVDHHRPDGVADGATLISGYDWDPIPNTSLLLFDLCAALTDISDCDWIAAIGVISDLGERAPFALLDATKKKYGGKWLREAATLVNAARRASRYQPETAVRALLDHASPRELVESQSDELRELRAAREEVQEAMYWAKKAAPVFAGKVALVRVHSACQIHPVIAQIWRGRLPKYIVIVANDEYLPGRVNFSARSSGDESALDFLRSIELSPGEGSYAHGHDHATGGSLEVERWNELLRKIGFE